MRADKHGYVRCGAAWDVGLALEAVRALALRVFEMEDALREVGR